MREDVFRDEVFFAAARPPRAPAVRTDIVPRPLVDFFFDELVLDLRAVARPPAAPAFFFCAVLPARPPLAPALRTVIVFVFRLAAVLFRAAVVFLRGVVVFRAVVFFAVERFVALFRAVVFLAAPDERAAVVFLREEREDDPEEREEDEDDDLDLVSPASDRCLLTVRAAISVARPVERPCFFSESLMCSY